ncbi:VCBS repeat-containing protein [Dokdonia pacifica]|uniref:Repeat domain-containing protein n=1 Tax=Dokdonia pacifica TaxID=1627892 RepID=A0A238ZBM9_9FLAO|nr:VCBS repeat-containing protein [Dokdonia pacifica]SNR80388.1 Repeat domain-containing protein [Dokdonia pacifica]
MKCKNVIILLCGLFLIVSCSENQSAVLKDGTYTDGAKTLYTKVETTTSNISFKNIIREDLGYNFLNYPYLYTGAGVAVGDVDNDGLDDIYLTANFGPNKLYKNKGNFQFEDITSHAQLTDEMGFTTGATMLDINNDGWLDIYVSKAGSLDNDDARRNKLYVNQGNGIFKEEASKWGVDDPGYSTQAYSLDYDNDGDLDLYVLNYRYDFKNNVAISGAIQRAKEEITSDQLYRNDGTHFIKVTHQAGIYNKTWGLSGAVGDFNNDGWDDIYVSNDYLEPDMMYINQKDGTFKNEATIRVNHISFNSMGSDYADLNNDGFEDLVTVDMLAENYARSKENMKSMSTENFNTLVRVGYHHAYMANMLHFNEGNGKFKETGQLSGVVKTDWSWAPLLADFDNDGLKDIFVSNGVYKDYHNQDFRNQLEALDQEGKPVSLQSVLDMMPSEKLDNYIYKNNGDLTFQKVIKEWGLEDPNFSNGAAYADFDNDGDLDLIVNNINDEIGLYRNNANVNAIQIILDGPATNKQGIGAEVYVKNGERVQHQKKYITRGFQSSVTPTLHFGLDDYTIVDEIVVQWPDGKKTTLNQVDANKKITIAYAGAILDDAPLKQYESITAKKDASSLGLNYKHIENNFNDYDKQLLLPQKQSTKGTGIAKGDINNDGLEDVFVGNALGAEAALFVQNNNGTFVKTNQALWQKEARYEDANALFVDIDGDQDQDLYVVSAGYELSENSPLLQDRLYINDGNGNFKKNSQALPTMRTSGKSIIAGDYDNDGDQDLFVGGNVIPGKYPVSPESYLLKNTNGKFTKDANASIALSEIGMVSEAIFTDYDNDQDLDLLVAGEWMQPTFFTNNNGNFDKDITIDGLENTEGWWFSVVANDFDNDGDQDYVLGNIGKNNKFHPSSKKPITIYGKDFDDNGSFDVALSKIANGKVVPVRGKECSSEQNPFLLEKIGSYKEFANLGIKDIYGEDRLKGAYELKAHIFESVYLQNNGNGYFDVKVLPNQAQVGPTLSMLSKDFNNDGFLDIIGVGAIYDAEVETIRYDSNYGYVLLGDGKGNFKHTKKYDPFIDRDSKDIETVIINGKEHYIVVSNNASLDVFTF